MEGEIATEQYVNSSQVKVSFEVLDDDWCLIRQSEIWHRLGNFLSETGNKHIQMSLTEKVCLLEEGQKK